MLKAGDSKPVLGILVGVVYRDGPCSYSTGFKEWTSEAGQQCCMQTAACVAAGTALAVALQEQLHRLAGIH